MTRATRSWSKEDETILKGKYKELSNNELASLLGRTPSSIEKKLSKMGLRREAVPASFSDDVNLHAQKFTTRELTNRYKEAIEENLILQKKVDIVVGMKDNFSIHKIENIKSSTNDNEATAIVQWSDWHSEETVPLSQTNGLNSFNANIFNKRAEQLFKTTVRFVDIFRKDIVVNKLVIQLGGDFISGNIHDELKEGNSAGVMTACITAINTIATGLKFIQDNTKGLEIICVCNAGNHSRITMKQRISTEYDNSLETLMYVMLQDKFPDIKFLIDDSYFKYLDIYGWQCRFHHGHSIQYGGGVGGIFISAYKKIAQWNKGKKVDYDFFGHFHQAKDGGNFLCNGSLIGYNAYAVFIGADYERPKQNICLIDKKRGKTIVAPIILD